MIRILICLLAASPFVFSRATRNEDEDVLATLLADLLEAKLSVPVVAEKPSQWIEDMVSQFEVENFEDMISEFEVAGAFLGKFSKYRNKDCGGSPLKTISSSIGYPYMPPGNDLGECAKVCYEHPRCSRFSVDQDTDLCYFKTGSGHSPSNNAVDCYLKTKWASGREYLSKFTKNPNKSCGGSRMGSIWGSTQKHDLGECAKSCLANPTCSGFSADQDTDHCYFKTGTGHSTVNNNSLDCYMKTTASQKKYLKKFTKYLNKDCGGSPLKTLSNSIGYPWSPPGNDLGECAKVCYEHPRCSRFSVYDKQCYFKSGIAHSPSNNAVNCYLRIHSSVPHFDQ